MATPQLDLKILASVDYRQMEAQLNAMIGRMSASMQRLNAGRNLNGQFMSTSELDRESKAVKKLATEISAVQRTLNVGTRNPFKQVETGARGAADAIEHIGRSGKFAVRVLEAFFLYRGFVALQQGAMAVTRHMVDLNHQVSLILTQLPNFGEGMRGVFTQGILDVSKKTGQSFDQVAQALYQITSAGYSGAEAMKVLEATTKAAVAGGTDAANAFNAAQAQMGAFGIEASHISEVYDKQFQLVRRGIFSYEQLTQVVGVISEAFATAGQSIETANAALATVSQVFTGPQLARGATGIRNLAEALTQRESEFSKLGIATRDVNGDMRNLIDVVDDLSKKMDGMASGDKARLISTLVPDVREQAGIQALMANMDDLKRNYVEQKLAVGDLDRAYGVFEKDTKTVAKEVLQSVESGFKPLERSLNAGVLAIGGLDRMFPGFIGSVVTATAAVTALGVALQFLNAQSAVPMTYLGPAGLAKGATPAMLTRGQAFGQFLRSPGFRVGASGVGGFAAGTVIGNQFGQNPASMLGAVGVGAAGGAMLGGPWGALAGGVAAGAPFLVSAITGSFRESSKDAGKTMAEVFGETLAASGSVEDAFEAAVATAAVGVANAGLTTALSSIASGSATLPGFTSTGPMANPYQNPFLRLSYAAGAGVIKGGNNLMDFIGASESSKVLFDRNVAGMNIIGPLQAAQIARSEGIDRVRELNAGATSPLSDNAMRTLVGGPDGLAITSIGKIYDEAIREALGEGGEAGQARAEALANMKAFAIAIASSTLATEDFTEIQEIAASVDPNDAKSVAEAGFKIMNLLENKAEAAAVAIEEAANALDYYTNSLQRNALDSREIELRAKLQNRRMTAEEIDQMKRLEFEALRLEREKMAVESEIDSQKNLTDATKENTEATVENTAAIVEMGPPSSLAMQPGQAGGEQMGPPSSLANQPNPYGGNYQYQQGGPNGTSVSGGWREGYGAGGQEMIEAVGADEAEDPESQFEASADSVGWAAASGSGVGWLSGGNNRRNSRYTGFMERMGLNTGRLGENSAYGDLLGMQQQSVFGNGSLYSNMSQESVRMFDSMTGGIKPAAQYTLAKQIGSVLGPALFNMIEAAKRGAQNVVNFNGPTVPSELDLAIREMLRLAPLVSRSAARQR